MIILKGNPKSTNNIYKSRSMGKFIGVYMTAQGKKLKESYKQQVHEQYKKKPLSEDVDLRLELFFGDKRTRDIDNYNKIVLDACTGVLWKDDSQIQSLLIIKNYDKKNPRIELEIN